MCILGEPTEQKIVLGHYGSLWMRISTSGPFIHTAFSEGRREGERRSCACATCSTPSWSLPPNGRSELVRRKEGIVNIGAISGGFAWRVSRTPHRTDLFVDFRVPPTMPMAEARSALGDFVRGLRERFPDHGIESEVYVTAPGSEIAEDHPLIGAIDEAHEAGLRHEAGTRHGALVLGCVGADPLRDRERELRHVERPARSGARREPRGRRAREDGRRLCAVVQRVCAEEGKR